MNESLIALSSIFFGVLGTVIFTKLSSKLYFGLTGNIIISVFGSVFFSKLFGSIGIHPSSILTNGDVNLFFLIVNYSISICGSILTLILVRKIVTKYQLEN